MHEGWSLLHSHLTQPSALRNTVTTVVAEYVQLTHNTKLLNPQTGQSEIHMVA